MYSFVQQRCRHSLLPAGQIVSVRFELSQGENVTACKRLGGETVG
jgi:hypothetical protein